MHMRTEEGHADAQHERLLQPVLELVLRVRRSGVEAAHHGDLIGTACRRSESRDVVFALPGRRYHDGTVYAGLLHLGQHLFDAVAAVALYVWAVACRPRTVRTVGFPKVDL